jgi:hypothetical protein
VGDMFLFIYLFILFLDKKHIFIGTIIIITIINFKHKNYKAEYLGLFGEFNQNRK